IRESIDDALAKARPLRRVLEDREGAKRRLRQKVGFAGRSTAEIREAIEHGTLLLPGDCRALVEALGGDPLKTRGARFVDYLARGNLDHPSCDDLIEAFLTDAGTPRANLVAAKDRILHGDLAARFDIEGARIGKLAGEMI